MTDFNVLNFGAGGTETINSTSEFPSDPDNGDEVILEKNGHRVLYVYDASLGTGTWHPQGWYVRLDSDNGEVDVFNPRIVDQGGISMYAPFPHFIGIRDYRGIVSDDEWTSVNQPTTPERRGIEHGGSDLQTQAVFNGTFIDPEIHTEHQQLTDLTIRAVFRAVAMDPTNHSYGIKPIARVDGEDSSGSANAIASGLAVRQNGPRGEIRWLNEDDSLNNREAFWDWPFGFIDGQTYFITLTKDSNQIVRCYVNGHKLNRITEITNGSDAGGSNGGGDFSPTDVTTDASNGRLKIRTEPGFVATYASQLWSDQKSRSTLRSFRDEIAPTLLDNTSKTEGVTDVMSNFAKNNDIARLYPDTSNADGLTDQTGQTSGWLSTGTTENIFDGNEMASIGQTRWDSDRSEYITRGTITHRMYILYLDNGNYAYFDVNPNSGSNLYKIHITQADDGSGNTEIRYLHQHEGGGDAFTDEAAFYKVPKPRLGSLHVHCMTRVDNGDGTVSVRFYWDGSVQTVDSFNSESGNGTTEDNGNTFTAPKPDNNSTYELGLFGTRGTQSDMKSYALGHWVESEFSSDQREADIADALLS